MLMRKPATIILAALTAFVICGCQSDTGTASKEVVNKDQAVQKQAGKGGTKASMGGGLVDEPVGAPPGTKTGMPQGGSKAGG